MSAGRAIYVQVVFIRLVCVLFTRVKQRNRFRSDGLRKKKNGFLLFFIIIIIPRVRYRGESSFVNNYEPDDRADICPSEFAGDTARDPKRRALSPANNYTTTRVNRSDKPLLVDQRYRVYRTCAQVGRQVLPPRCRPVTNFRLCAPVGIYNISRSPGRRRSFAVFYTHTRQRVQV